MFKRVVIKLSGEALAGSGKNSAHFDDETIDGIGLQLKNILNNGTEAAMIVGGGNIWRGRNARPDMAKEKADRMGMLATVINGIYLCEAFGRQGVEARVATPFPINDWTFHYEQDKARKLMSEGVVIISAAGLGHPWFSTDTVTVLRAAELQAEAILFAKTVDGVYDNDPCKFKGARKYKTLSYQTAIEKNLGVADMSALCLARDAGIASYAFGLNISDSLFLAASYPRTGLLQGTYVNNNIEEVFYV